MRKSIKSALFGLASGTVAFLAGAWVIFSVLLRCEGGLQIPTDPDYAQAAALGIWTVFVRAVFGGTVIGLITFALVVWYTFRQTQNSAPTKSEFV